MSDTEVKHYPLVKNVYPTWIKMFFGLAILSFLYVVIVFFRYEFAYHLDLNKKMVKAEQAFFDKNYDISINLYQELLKQHSNFKQAKIRIAEMYFVLSGDSDENYAIGLSYLSKEVFTQEEVLEMKKWVPERLKDNFKSNFTSKR